MNKDYYRSLGLTFFAEDVVIRSAFKLKAHHYHPDKYPNNPEHAQDKGKIVRTYKIYSDAGKHRKKSHRELDQKPGPHPQTSRLF